MGVFNMIDGAPEGYDKQVKCWEWHELTLKFVGLDSPVPRIEGHDTYSVRYNTSDPHNLPPRYWHVRAGRITAINEQRAQEGFPVFDKWGGRL